MSMNPLMIHQREFDRSLSLAPLAGFPALTIPAYAVLSNVAPVPQHDVAKAAGAGQAVAKALAPIPGYDAIDNFEERKS